MTQYVAFMRAINVAGHAIVKMDDLKSAFTASGCVRVRSYIQSGNVVFDGPTGKAATALFESVRSGLRELLGSDPGIMFRTVRDVERIVSSAPFLRFETEARLKLYVVFLARKPTVRPAFPLRSDKEALDAIAMTNREVFIVSRQKKNGFYGFPNNFIEKALGVPATSRNWSTVTRIVALARSER
jgi:uncharacterized protein (DUF1697 family)